MGTVAMRGLNNNNYEAVKVYQAYGPIWKFDNGTSTGSGAATVTVFDEKIAMVQFTLKIESAGTASDFNGGISPQMLKALNGNIPTIIPFTGGSCDYRNDSGQIVAGLQGYGGTFQFDGSGFWKPARVYTAAGNVGAWPDNQFPAGFTITGVCWGSVQGG